MENVEFTQGHVQMDTRGSACVVAAPLATAGPARAATGADAVAETTVKVIASGLKNPP